MAHYTVYAKECFDMQWDVAHLYEHMIIRGFMNYLQANGVASGMAGYMNGETFSAAIFLDIGLYDQKSYDILFRYIGNEPNFTDADIEKSLRHIQSEELALLTVNNKAQLRKQLTKLKKRAWIASDNKIFEDLSPYPVQNAGPLASRRNRRAFASTKLIVSLASDNSEELALFCRLWVLMNDLITDALIETYDSYKQDTVWPERKGNKISCRLDLMHDKSVNSAQMARTAQQSISELLQSQNYVYIKNHFKATTTVQHLKGLPVDYFRSTGMLIGNKTMQELATFESVKSIVSKVKITSVSITANK